MARQQRHHWQRGAGVRSGHSDPPRRSFTQGKNRTASHLPATLAAPKRKGVSPFRQQPNASHSLNLSRFPSSQHAAQCTLWAGVRTCMHFTWLAKEPFVKPGPSDFLDRRFSLPQVSFPPRTTLVKTEIPSSRETEESRSPEGFTNLFVNYRKSAPNPRGSRLNNTTMSLEIFLAFSGKT